jgi:hypothetical protein
MFTDTILPSADHRVLGFAVAIIVGGVPSIFTDCDGRGVSVLPAWSTLPKVTVCTPSPETVNGPV